MGTLNHTKDALKKRAQTIYEDPDNGVNTFEQVADKLGVSLTAIKTWYYKDRDSGNKWEKVDNKDTNYPTYIKENTPAEVIGEENLIPNLFDNVDLNYQQKMWCFYYLQSYNATDAAKKAGYSKKSTKMIGYNLKNHKEIQKALEHLSNILSTKLFLTAERLMERHAKVAFSDMADFVDYGYEKVKQPVYDGAGNLTDYKEIEKPYYRLKPIKDVDSTLIKSVTRTRGGIDVELEDRSKSLNTLTKLITLSKKDEHRLNIKDTDNPVELAKKLKQLPDDKMKVILDELNK